MKRHAYVHLRINNYRVLFRLEKATEHIQHVYISWQVLAVAYFKSMIGRQPSRVIRGWWVIISTILSICLNKILLCFYSEANLHMFKPCSKKKIFIRILRGIQGRFIFLKTRYHTTGYKSRMKRKTLLT